MSLPQELVQQFQGFENQYNLFIKKIATEHVPSNCVEKGKTMSTQTITLPEGFARVKKVMSPDLAECYENQEEWDSFLSQAQIEIFGSERSRSHPMNSAFKLYLEQLEFVKNYDEDGKIEPCDRCPCKDISWCMSSGCMSEDDDDEEQDFCGLLRAQAAQARADVNYNSQFEMSTEEYEKIKAENKTLE